MPTSTFSSFDIISSSSKYDKLMRVFCRVRDRSPHSRKVPSSVSGFRFPAKDEDSKTLVNNKLRLIQLVGEGRGRRALAAWPHRAALVLRARDHAATLLSGAAHAPRAPRDHRAVADSGTAPTASTVHRHFTCVTSLCYQQRSVATQQLQYSSSGFSNFSALPTNPLPF